MAAKGINLWRSLPSNEIEVQFQGGTSSIMSATFVVLHVYFKLNAN